MFDERCFVVLTDPILFVSLKGISPKIIIMANDMYFLFKAEDVKKLLEKGAVTIKAFSKLVPGEIKNRQVAVMMVGAEGLDKNDRAVGEIAGCPCPPCSPKNADKFFD